MNAVDPVGSPFRIPLSVRVPGGVTGDTVSAVILPRMKAWHPWCDLSVEKGGEVVAVVERDALPALESRVRRMVRDEVERDLRIWLKIGKTVLARKVAP